MNHTRVLLCFGTRPEAIKMAPLIEELRLRDDFEAHVCVTGQHRRMLDQILDLFEIVPDYDLELMTPNQTLGGLTGDMVVRMSQVLREEAPDLVLVQGDTTTTFVAALAALYEKVPVGHIEAGLRSHRRYAPFPEEINRRLTSTLAHWHFAPTERARQALLREGFDDDTLFVVGNTVIDTLLSVVDQARATGLPSNLELEHKLSAGPFVLVTGHRRESFGKGFRSICRAIARIARAREDLNIVYPVHLNPNVREPVYSILAGIDNVHLIEPLDYLEFVWLMDSCRLILTDSGGIQEEAPSLGKPVLVMRETTERPEAVEAGAAKLVGFDEELIVETTNRVLEDEGLYRTMSTVCNPYGKGDSARRILDVLVELRSRAGGLDNVAC